MQTEVKKVNYRNEKDRQIVELWCSGMSMKNIAVAINRKTTEGVRRVLGMYCGRTRDFSADGRSWAYRITRDIHDDAPLSLAEQNALWPRPLYDYSGYTEESYGLVGNVLRAADAFNEALDDLNITGGGPGDPEAPKPMRPVMQIYQGRLFVAIDVPRGEPPE